MNPPTKFRSGNALFHLLTETRRIGESALNFFRYTYPVPGQSVHSADYALSSPATTCHTVHPEEPYQLDLPKTIPPDAVWRFAKESRGVFPQQCILELPDARILGDGHVITRENLLLADLAMDFHRTPPYHWLLSACRLPKPETIQGSVAVLSSPGSRNYFHWTLDTLPRIQILKDRMDTIDWFYINCNARFHKEWISMLQLPERKLLPAGAYAHFQAENLVVPSYGGEPGFPTLRALDFIRSSIPPQNKPPHRKLYISRAHARRRKILNETALLPLLEQHGFEVVHLAHLGIREQMELFSTASHIISPHGAELTNLAYCSPGTKLMEIFSPYYINPCYWKIAAQLSLDYSCEIGTGGGSVLKKQKDPHYVWVNIHLDPSSFSRRVAEFSQR